MQLNLKQQINEIRRMQQLAGLIKESQLNEAEDIASFLNANMDEFVQKVGDPGSEFETMGDPLVATAGTDDMSGIDVCMVINTDNAAIIICFFLR